MWNALVKLGLKSQVTSDYIAFTMGWFQKKKKVSPLQKPEIQANPWKTWVMAHKAALPNLKCFAFFEKIRNAF